MNAAISSCLTWMNWKSSPVRLRAPRRPLMPSPGYPKIVVTPHSFILPQK